MALYRLFRKNTIILSLAFYTKSQAILSKILAKQVPQAAYKILRAKLRRNKRQRNSSLQK